jgi:hypothetical protein
LLPEFLQALRSRTWAVTTPALLNTYSRRAQTARLASLFQSVVGSRSAATPA